MLKRNLKIQIDNGNDVEPKLSVRQSVRASVRHKVFQTKVEKPANLDEMNTFEGRFGDMLGREVS